MTRLATSLLSAAVLLAACGQPEPYELGSAHPAVTGVAAVGAAEVQCDKGNAEDGETKPDKCKTDNDGVYCGCMVSCEGSLNNGWQPASDVTEYGCGNETWLPTVCNNKRYYWPKVDPS